MQHTLESQGYIAIIDEVGAELISLKNPQGEEFMWSGDEKYWTGRSPILFPIIGRLKGGGYTLDGEHYEMEKHGLVRKKPWELVDSAVDGVTLSTRADDNTRKHYPFDYELRVHFQLVGPSLSVNYSVMNHGDAEMLFSLGSHPAFALPLTEGEGLDQWSVEFSEEETLDRQVLDGGLIGENPMLKFMDQSRKIPLSETIFDDDSLIFFDVRSQRLDLVHAEKGRCLSLYTGGAPDLGIWAKPGAPYVCLEPWYGYDDPVNTSGNFREKPGLVKLDPADTFRTSIRIELAR
uniref:Aldose 1-epimerase family protein n=1 Tax=uncultured Thiotrichaceae bacterium TaxID=298394 RepID=A0A6S6UII0_9GAMM|nr:MAG: Unknown protein [uncultured Thiotrichaceae bacterium]